MTGLSVIVTGGRHYGMAVDRDGLWVYGYRPSDDFLHRGVEPVELARAQAEVAWLDETLDALDMLCMAQGGATGADALARRWARWRGVWCVPYEADWNRYGKAAGPIRNERMLADFRPDLVVAFPGGRGTAHMVDIASRAGVRVMVVSRSQSARGIAPWPAE